VQKETQKGKTYLEMQPVKAATYLDEQTIRAVPAAYVKATVNLQYITKPQKHPSISFSILTPE
jgi:hypothetical protein